MTKTRKIRTIKTPPKEGTIKVKEIKDALKEIKKKKSYTPYHVYNKNANSIGNVKIEDKPKVRINLEETIKESKFIDFYDAIDHFVKGKYVSRSSWKDYYFFKVNEHGNIMISDPKRYGMRIWVPTVDDLTANDWIVIDNAK